MYTHVVIGMLQICGLLCHNTTCRIRGIHCQRSGEGCAYDKLTFSTCPRSFNTLSPLSSFYLSCNTSQSPLSHTIHHNVFYCIAPFLLCLFPLQRGPRSQQWQWVTSTGTATCTPACRQGSSRFPCSAASLSTSLVLHTMTTHRHWGRNENGER